MPRGPHDEEIEDHNPEEDKSRRRLEEFLRQRDPNIPPEQKNPDPKQPEQ